MKKRGLESQRHERLAKALTKARSNFGLSQKGNSLKDRDTSPLITSHLSSLDVTPNTADVEAIIFSNSSYVFRAEGEVGRFYVSGEYIRSDVRESEEGVPVVIDAEFLDINTCIGISDLYWDIWNASSTSIYGGVPVETEMGTQQTPPTSTKPSFAAFNLLTMKALFNSLLCFPVITLAEQITSMLLHM